MALLIGRAHTPAFPVDGFTTSGIYPEVLGTKPRFVKVNAGLRQAILADQAIDAPAAQLSISANRQGGGTGTGFYGTEIDKPLISASTVEVSALIPVESLVPSGTDGAMWISATLRVPSGVAVKLPTLFKNPRVGLMVLARSDAVAAWKDNPCLHSRSFHQFTTSSFWTNPSFDDFTTFALTPKGLAVGYDNGVLGSEGCGRIAVTVPYSTLTPYLSPEGRTFVAGVRAPRFTF